MQFYNFRKFLIGIVSDEYCIYPTHVEENLPQTPEFRAAPDQTTQTPR